MPRNNCTYQNCGILPGYFTSSSDHFSSLGFGTSLVISPTPPLSPSTLPPKPRSATVPKTRGGICSGAVQPSGRDPRILFQETIANKGNTFVSNQYGPWRIHYGAGTSWSSLRPQLLTPTFSLQNTRGFGLSSYPPS